MSLFSSDLSQVLSEGLHILNYASDLSLFPLFYIFLVWKKNELVNPNLDSLIFPRKVISNLRGDLKRANRRFCFRRIETTRIPEVLERNRRKLKTDALLIFNQLRIVTITDCCFLGNL